jgi:acetylserotonin N-methyltransferase
VTYDLPPTDDRAVWDTWLSMHHLPSLTVADELGVFRALHEAPGAPGQLADRLGYDRRTTIAIVRMLAALGYLQQHLGVYQLTEPARLYLLKDSPYYWGHMLGNRTNLHDTLKSRLQGRSPEGIPGQRPEPEKTESSASSWASGQVDLERARRVAAAMHSHSLPAATGLARIADFWGVSRLLDVGGGSGCYPIAIARARPGLRATIMELPAMCEVAQEYIREGRVAGQVDTLAVDMFREPWPHGYDAHFYANVWHDWNFETCAWLARQSFDSLPGAGRIFLHEMLLDDDGDGPTTTVGFSMLMLGTEGQQFTLPELKALLEAAGFTDVQARRTYGYYSLVSARKPEGVRL